jgi:hypothetical protein
VVDADDHRGPQAGDLAGVVHSPMPRHRPAGVLGDADVQAGYGIDGGIQASGWSVSQPYL